MSFAGSSSYISKYDYYTKHRRHMKMMLVVVAIVILAFNVWLISFIVGKIKTNADIKKTYNEAVRNYEEGMKNYDKELLDNAYNAFSNIPDYKKSKDYMSEISDEKGRMVSYDSALSDLESGDYAKSINGFHCLGNYRDSEDRINDMSKSLFEGANEKISASDYDAARKLLLMIPEYNSYYENAKELLSSIDEKEKEEKLLASYNQAVESYNSEDYEKAQSEFRKLKNYSNSMDYLDQIGAIYYSNAQTAYDNKDYPSCIDALEHIDSEEEWSNYNDALDLKDTLSSTYKTDFESTALEKLYLEGVSSFEDYVNAGICEFYSTTEANSFISAHQPVYLDTLSPYERGSWESAPYLFAVDWTDNLYFEDDIKDEDGNNHKHCLCGSGTYATWHLKDEGYTKMVGTMFVVEGNNVTTDSPIFFMVEDGDGNELYRHQLCSGFGGESFSIDIPEGTTDLKIYFDGTYCDFLDYNVYGSVGELALLK